LSKKRNKAAPKEEEEKKSATAQSRPASSSYSGGVTCARQGAHRGVLALSRLVCLFFNGSAVLPTNGRASAIQPCPVLVLFRSHFTRLGDQLHLLVYFFFWFLQNDSWPSDKSEKTLFHLLRLSLLVALNLFLHKLFFARSYTKNQKNLHERPISKNRRLDTNVTTPRNRKNQDVKNKDTAKKNQRELLRTKNRKTC
jgi:hypothetical protein